jgi:hypothetical protein
VGEFGVAAGGNSFGWYVTEYLGERTKRVVVVDDRAARQAERADGHHYLEHLRRECEVVSFSGALRARDQIRKRGPKRYANASGVVRLSRFQVLMRIEQSRSLQGIEELVEVRPLEEQLEPLPSVFGTFLHALDKIELIPRQLSH